MLPAGTTLSQGGHHLDQGDEYDEDDDHDHDEEEYERTTPSPSDELDIKEST